MKKSPYVTVIIPYKNNIDYLFMALESICIQSYKNFKILIIYDDEDKSDLNKIKNFLNKTDIKKKVSLEMIVNKKSLGAGYARNVGMKKSKTKYVAFLDADDLWLKNKLKIQVNFMEKYKQVFSHSSYFIINSKNEIISQRRTQSILTYNQLVKSCDIGLSTVMLNLNFIKKNKFFFPKIKTKEDYVLWLKILLKIKKIKGISQKLSHYRKTKNSLSSNKILSLINGYRVYYKYLKYNKIKSLYHLLILAFNSLKKNFQLYLKFK
jgi:teichuronic acid biosynthesis glycosyltransferase TuaG